MKALTTLLASLLLLSAAQICLSEEIAESDGKTHATSKDVAEACFGACGGKSTSHLLTRKVKGSKAKIDEILKDRKSGVINPDNSDGLLEGKKTNEPQGI